MHRKFSVLLSLLFTVSISNAQVAENTLTNDLKKEIKRLHEKWRLVGSAVMIIKDNNEILLELNGVKEFGGQEKIDNNTLFPIASLSKAMSAAAVGILVDRKLLNWDDKVVKHIPEFELYESYLTKEITIKDLIIHDVGLSQSDINSVINSSDINHIITNLKFAAPSSSFRERFMYQTTLYNVLGEIIKRKTNTDYDTFITENLFKPLKMHNTYANELLSLNYVNRVSDHIATREGIKVSRKTQAQNFGPGAGVWSTIDDMGKWMTFLLNDGKDKNGKIILSEKNFNELFKPSMIVPEDEFYFTYKIFQPKWITYGLGWFQHDYFGERVDFHTGNLSGTMSILGLIRDKKLGVIVLANNYSIARQIIMYQIFDSFSGNHKKRDWSELIIELRKQ